MPLALWTAHEDRAVRDESSVNDNVVGARAAHAENAPGLKHLDATGFEREREMQNGRPALRIVPHGTGDEYVADWSAAGEDLARSDAPAALNASRLACPCDPVRSAAADKDEVVAGDAP